MRLVVIAFFCSGCNINAGIGVHSNAIDDDNFAEEKVLGVVRASHQFDNGVEIYGEHISKKGNDSGRGLNHAGALIEFW